MFRRRAKETPVSRDEVTNLIRMLMRMDWKPNLVLDELEIDHGEEGPEDRP